MFCAGGIATNAGVAAAHTWFHAQKTTPKAIAIAAATTMSTVRQLQLIPLMSCTSLWCFENEQRTFANRDLRGERRDLVAETASAAEAERPATRFEPDAVVAGVCEEEKVRRLVVEALPAKSTEQDDLRRARGDRLGDRELEIGLVLRR